MHWNRRNCEKKLEKYLLPWTEAFGRIKENFLMIIQKVNVLEEEELWEETWEVFVSTNWSIWKNKGRLFDGHLWMKRTWRTLTNWNILQEKREKKRSFPRRTIARRETIEAFGRIRKYFLRIVQNKRDFGLKCEGRRRVKFFFDRI